MAFPFWWRYYSITDGFADIYSSTKNVPFCVVLDVLRPEGPRTKTTVLRASRQDAEIMASHQDDSVKGLAPRWRQGPRDKTPR